MPPRFPFTAPISLILLTLFACPACKQDSPPPADPPASAPDSASAAGVPDENFDPEDYSSSPEALLAHIKILLKKRPVPYREWFEQFLIRSPLQEKWWDYINYWEIPKQELEQAILAHFNPGVTFNEKDLWPHQVMELTDQSEDEAIVVCKDDFGLEGGREMLLYMRKEGGKWSLTADSYEAMSTFQGDYFKDYNIDLSALPAAIEEIIRRMKAGEFTTPSEVRNAASQEFNRIKDAALSTSPPPVPPVPPTSAPAGS